MSSTEMKSYLSLIPLSAKLRRRQNRMTILCIVIAVFLVGAVFSVADMMLRTQMERTAGKDGNWHLQVAGITQSQAEQLAQQPDVVCAGAGAAFNEDGEEDYRLNGKRVVLYGCDEQFLRVNRAAAFEGTFPEQDGEVLLGKGAARILGVEIGDVITVNGVQLTVVGAFSQGVFPDDVTIIAPETLFRRVAGKQNYNLIGVQLDRTAGDETVLALAAFSSDQIVVHDLRESNRQDRGTYYAARIVLYGFLAIIGCISLLNIVNSISMSVSARMKQYGILRAIGMDDAQLKRMVSAEAGTYAVSGLVVGIALGLVLNQMLYTRLITHYFGAAWQVPWGCLAVIAAVVLAAVVLAVGTPVKRILMQPITATISEL